MANIEKLEELLSPYTNGGKQIVSTKITPLTKPGENYGSEMLKVDISIKDKNGKQEELNVVAKLIPINEFARIIFNVQVSFNLEAKFYSSIVPTLQAFQRKEGIKNVIDSFPKFYCARNNLQNNSDVVDEDAVLVLENLKARGFGNGDRNVGFDFPTSKLILKKLAEFQVIPIALKLNDPKLFDAKIKAYMSCNYPSHTFPPPGGSMQSIIAILRDSEKCSHIIPKLEKSAKKFSKLCDDFREPFTTIGHRDMWVNNIMLKFDGQAAIDCKFVDFQSYSYDSPAADLFFFLFTSVQEEVLKNNLDDLLEEYHRNFVRNLKLLNCDLQFPYEKLLEEITLSAEWELVHTLFMYLFVIQGKGVAMPDGPKDELYLSKIQFDEHVKQRIIWMLKECDRRKWLNF